MRMGDPVTRYVEDGVFNPECTMMFTFPNLSNSKHSGHSSSSEVHNLLYLSSSKAFLTQRERAQGFPLESKKSLLFLLL